MKYKRWNTHYIMVITTHLHTDGVGRWESRREAVVHVSCGLRFTARQTQLAGVARALLAHPLLHSTVNGHHECCVLHHYHTAQSTGTMSAVYSITTTQHSQRAPWVLCWVLHHYHTAQSTGTIGVFPIGDIFLFLLCQSDCSECCHESLLCW